MISYPRVFWFVLSFVGAMAASLPTTRAEKPASLLPKMPSWVVVKPGPNASKIPRPIEPTSYLVQFGAVAPKTEIPIEMEIRNVSAQPIKVLGGETGCSSRGCVRMLGHFPRLIRPGASDKIMILYTSPSEQDSNSVHPLIFDTSFFVSGSSTFVVSCRIIGNVTVPLSPELGPQE